MTESQRELPAGDNSLFGRPYSWVLLAVAMLALPLGAWMAEAGMSWERAHPAVNAMLNGTSALFLVVGWRAARRGKRGLHRQCMISALVFSCLFLASYLIRYKISGSHKYPGDGWDRNLYLAVLGSHSLLALVTLPLVARTVYLAARSRTSQHRRIARWTMPIWAYVSVTGVLVYLMLYPIAERVYGP